MMRRFYKEVTVEEADGGFQVTLDGRPLRTPAKAPLVLPTSGFARAVAEEWEAQSERIDPAAMPRTQIANTGIDRVPARRQEIVDEVLRYAETDLICYRASQPPALVERQSRAWDPLLRWLEETYGARLATTSGILATDQPRAALDTLRRAVESRSDLALAALHLAVAIAGSLVIGLALSEGRLDAEEAHEAAQLDELHQLAQWGEDAEARDRIERVREELRVAADFLELCRGA